jgi:hypothetical protein
MPFDVVAALSYDKNKSTNAHVSVLMAIKTQLVENRIWLIVPKRLMAYFKPMPSGLKEESGENPEQAETRPRYQTLPREATAATVLRKARDFMRSMGESRPLGNWEGEVAAMGAPLNALSRENYFERII